MTVWAVILHHESISDQTDIRKVFDAQIDAMRYRRSLHHVERQYADIVPLEVSSGWKRPVYWHITYHDAPNVFGGHVNLSRTEERPSASLGTIRRNEMCAWWELWVEAPTEDDAASQAMAILWRKELAGDETA